MAEALAKTDPPADETKSAYAALYAKGFRYDFYRRLQQQAAHAAEQAPAPQDLDEVGNAKNRFGEALNALPTEQMRAVHAAFSKMFAAPLGDSMKLAVYRFAIFCLESPSEKIPAPPPF